MRERERERERGIKRGKERRVEADSLRNPEKTVS